MALELTMPCKTSVHLICLTISAFVSVHNSERIDHPKSGETGSRIVYRTLPLQRWSECSRSLIRADQNSAIRTGQNWSNSSRTDKNSVIKKGQSDHNWSKWTRLRHHFMSERFSESRFKFCSMIQRIIITISKDCQGASFESSAGTFWFVISIFTLQT